MSDGAQHTQEGRGVESCRQEGRGACNQSVGQVGGQDRCQPATVGLWPLRRTCEEAAAQALMPLTPAYGGDPTRIQRTHRATAARGPCGVSWFSAGADVAGNALRRGSRRFGVHRSPRAHSYLQELVCSCSRRSLSSQGRTVEAVRTCWTCQRLCERRQPQAAAGQGQGGEVELPRKRCRVLAVAEAAEPTSGGDEWGRRVGAISSSAMIFLCFDFSDLRYCGEHLRDPGSSRPRRRCRRL